MPCLATVPQPCAITCLDKVRWPSACLDTVPRISAMTCSAIEDKSPRGLHQSAHPCLIPDGEDGSLEA